MVRDLYGINPLISALNDRSKFVKEKTSDLLRKIGNPAVRSLITALEDERMWVRYYAVEVLGDIKDFSAVDPLIGALNDEYWNVIENAVMHCIK